LATAMLGLGDVATTRPAPAGEGGSVATTGKPTAVSTNQAARIVWGEAVNGVQVGLVPLGGDAAKDWKNATQCGSPKCGIMEKTAPGVGKCSGCGAATGSTSLRSCGACASAQRACSYCGASKPANPIFVEGEPMRLEIHAKNLTDKDVRLKGAGWRGSWQLIFYPAGGGVPRMARFMEEPRVAQDATVSKKGQSALDIALDVVCRFEHYFPEKARMVDPQLAASLKTLPSGKYTVTASYEHAMHAMDKTCPYWHGKVTSGAAEIEIAPKGAAAAPAAGVADEAAARRLALEYLAKHRPEVKPVKVQAFAVPGGGFWLVEYRDAQSRGPQMSPGPGVWVNAKTGVVSETAPAGAPARM